MTDHTDAIESKKYFFSLIKERYENSYLKGDRDPGSFTDARGIFVVILQMAYWQPINRPEFRPTEEEYDFLFKILLHFAYEEKRSSAIFADPDYPHDGWRPNHPFDKRGSLGHWTRKILEIFLDRQEELSPQGIFYKHFFESIFKESEIKKGGDE